MYIQLVLDNTTQVTLNASSVIESENEIEIVNGTLSETLSESSFCNYCVSEGSYDGLYPVKEKQCFTFYFHFKHMMVAQI